jgi:hypothetical protein
MTIGLLRQTSASRTNVTSSGKPPQPARAAPPDVCHGSPNDALRALRSGSDGLSAAEAVRRLAEFGPNDVERVERPSQALAFLAEFTHFFALILWVAAGLAFVAALAQPGTGMGMLALAIVGVIAVNGIFSFWQQHRAERALESLERLLPSQVPALRGGDSILLDAGGWTWGESLAAGDPLYRQATTACLAAIVAMQVVNVFVCRSERDSRAREPDWEETACSRSASPSSSR